MSIFFTKPWLKSLSGLFVNFAAGYFALVFIAPNIVDINLNTIAVLTWNLFFGIFFLVASVKAEELLEQL